VRRARYGFKGAAPDASPTAMDTRLALVSTPGSIAVETQQLPEPRDGEAVVGVRACHPQR
jgi:hypothetical protein